MQCTVVMSPENRIKCTALQAGAAPSSCGRQWCHTLRSCCTQEYYDERLLEMLGEGGGGRQALGTQEVWWGWGAMVEWHWGAYAGEFWRF